MRFEKQEPFGGETLASTWNEEDTTSKVKQFTSKSSNLPFGQHIDLSSIGGPTYVTTQTLIQQVAYSLSDKLYTYSPETFDLDIAVKQWAAAEAKNAYDNISSVQAMQTRTGAGAIALGYMFSKDFDLSKRHIPQALLASAASIRNLRAALDQLSLLYSVANPLVAHIAAVDYAAGSSSGLVSDYISSMNAAEELGLGLVSSASASEAQHMAVFATLLASVVPTLHVYDGVSLGRETLRVVDALDQSGLKKVYDNVTKQVAGTSKKTPPEIRASQLLKSFNEELGTTYEAFEYHGHKDAEAVLVVFGTVEASLASQVASNLASAGSSVGIVNVRIYRPFDEEAFLAALPTTTKVLAVLGQVSTPADVNDAAVHSSLHADVLAALAFADKFATAPQVVDHKYAREEVFTPSSMTAVLRRLTAKSNVTDEQPTLLNANEVEQYTFWDVDDSASSSAALVVGKLFSNDAKNNVSLKTSFDNFVQGGATRTDIRNSKRAISAAYAVEEADVVVVGDDRLFKDVDVLRSIKVGGKLIVRLPGAKVEDLEKKLPVGVRRDIQEKNVELYLLDPSQSGLLKTEPAVEPIVTELAFLRVARPDLLSSSFDTLVELNGNTSIMEEVRDDMAKALQKVEVPASWAEVQADTEIPKLPSTIYSSSFGAFDKTEEEHPAMLKDWQTVAKGLAFKEAYGTEAALRPDLSVKTYTITVKENRRLTPLTYDRNIFHIEFDLGTSGLKYDIGEALGIHAQNDHDQVVEFMEFYGLNADEIVEVPSRENPDIMDTRTVYQSLMQNIDIFGRPPKRFYEALADFASDEKEKKELLTLGGPEAGNEFTRRAEVDTVTYADILLEFASAHPSFHDIARIVSPMKRREYSIASSQMVNPTTVALMIVVVSWVDPKGRDRFGQATRYLARLPIGASVTASVKPSVMKLPTKDTAPLIMAGLGTGLAPFRAFVQYRAMQKAAGVDIGAILLYMGSRHQREEYLYGEEWEAYQDAGVITLLGRAFSRDQPQKIYIQDRMRESLTEIVDAYIKDEGSFYLCGPTWPVPDVTQVLEEAISHHAKLENKKVDSRKEIERLKDDLRYVLEVY